MCAGEQRQSDDAADGECNTSGAECHQNAFGTGGRGNRIAGQDGRVFVLQLTAGRVVGLECGGFGVVGGKCAQQQDEAREGDGEYTQRDGGVEPSSKCDPHNCHLPMVWVRLRACCRGTPGPLGRAAAPDEYHHGRDG